MRDFEPSDGILPYEPFCIQVPNVGERFIFNPLRKVISFDEEPFLVSHCPWEWPNYV